MAGKRPDQHNIAPGEAGSTDYKRYPQTTHGQNEDQSTEGDKQRLAESQRGGQPFPPDVPAPSTQIGGVPPQFDELVQRATARDAAGRYPDAAAMAEHLDAIAAELNLPAFQVPAPQNSAQHASAELHHSRMHEHTTERRPRTAAEPILPVRHPTRAMTRGPEDWADEDWADAPGTEGELPPVGQFAGIDLHEFAWARQRSRRAGVIWLAIVLVLTGSVAAAAWSLGSNLTALLGP